MYGVCCCCCSQVRCPGSWDHITNQIGMFSFTGLSKGQCQNMTDKWHVYMTMDGRYAGAVTINVTLLLGVHLTICVSTNSWWFALHAFSLCCMQLRCCIQCGHQDMRRVHGKAAAYASPDALLRLVARERQPLAAMSVSIQ
jgi:hypothetical protein